MPRFLFQRVFERALWNLDGDVSALERCLGNAVSQIHNFAKRRLVAILDPLVNSAGLGGRHIVCFALFSHIRGTGITLWSS